MAELVIKLHKSYYSKITLMLMVNNAIISFCYHTFPLNYTQ